MRRLLMPLHPALWFGRLRESSFRRQISTAASIGVLALALLTSLVSSWQASRQIRATLLEQGQRVAQSLAGQSALALLSGTPDNAADAVATTMAFPDVVGVELRGNDGRALLVRGDPGRVAARRAAASAPMLAQLVAETDDAWYFMASVVARGSDSPYEVSQAGAQWIGDAVVAQGKSTMQRMTAQVFFTNLAISLSFATALVLLIRLLAMRLTRPLTELAAVMGRAERGEADVQAPVGGPDDIARMARAFNRMLDAQRVREDELHEHRSRLEAAVAQRTLELQAAKERAESASAAKSDFLARMSHELRTPLNAVLGYAQLLKMDNGLSERQRAGLDTIHRSGEHLLGLIVDILDLARIEAGRTELFVEPTALAPLLRSVADVVRLKAEQKGLLLDLALAPGLPDQIEVDEQRLRQILLNLLGNAVKFTARGHVTLAVQAGPAPGGRARVRFEVGDSGVGMDSHALQRLFQPFEQAGDARQRAQGTGLGLAISRQLVQLMGSDIAVTSVPGHGSRFWFALELPVRSDDEAGAAASTGTTAPEAAHGQSYEGPRRRILVVDDVAVNREMACDLLEHLGFETATAADGIDALDRVEQARPDLVLMDTCMPRLDGLVATQRLRAALATSTLPVVMVSANAAPADRQGSLAAGANAFLAKPIDRGALIDVLTQLLALHWTAR